jgi:hypothetical protein
VLNKYLFYPHPGLPPWGNKKGGKDITLQVFDI